MRVLHVFDQAGVAGVMAKYQRELGHSVDVVVRNGYDVVGDKRFYSEHSVGPKNYSFKSLGRFGLPFRLFWRTCCVAYFYFYVACHSRKFDVVHIHSIWLVSLFLPFKSKVIEFHGSDVRRSIDRRWWIDRKVTGLFLRFSRRVFVSTPDLLGEL